MNSIKFSIIIPHYNTPKLLQRLLDSIPERSDVEIVVVDDNSSPEVVDFVNFPGYNRHNTRIIFDKKGGYGGYARNIGIDHAKGEWLLFADSDDYFTYCLSDVLDEFQRVNSHVDIIFCKACSLDSTYYYNTHRSDRLNSLIDRFQTHKAYAEKQLRFMFGEPWAKFVRREMVDRFKIRFEERSIHNDTAFSYLVGYHSREVAVCMKAVYCITDRIGSVSKQLTESKKIERIANFANASRFFTTHKIPITEKRHFIQLYKCLFSNIETYKKGVSELRLLGYSNFSIKKGMISAFLIDLLLSPFRMIKRRFMRILNNM